VASSRVWNNGVTVLLEGSTVSFPAIPVLDPDLRFAFDVKGRVRPQYCYKGKFLYDFDEVKKWFEGNKPSVSYKRHALVYLREYCEYMTKDPHQLCQERRARLRKDPTSTLDETLLNRWHEQVLLPQGMPSTAQGKFGKIVSFFEWNYLKLNIPKFPAVSVDMYHGPKRLRKEEIQRMLGFADSERDKLLLLVGAESGFRVRALNVLSLEHIVRLEDGTKEGLPARSRGDLADVMIPCRVQLPKRFYYGHKKEGVSFFCKDSIKLLDEYLMHREQLGEPITGKTPLFPTYRAIVRCIDNNAKVSTWLREHKRPGTVVRIRQRRPPGPKGVTYNIDAEVLEVHVKHASYGQLEAIMQELRNKARIEWNPEEEKAPSIHSLRKYLHSTLDAAGVNAHMVNVIIGHTNSIAEHYSGKTHLDYQEIRHAYESAMHRIAITEETNGPRVIKLEEKLRQFEETNKMLVGQLVEQQTRQSEKDKDDLRIEKKVEDIERRFEQFMKEWRLHRTSSNQ
jgi:integrase